MQHKNSKKPLHADNAPRLVMYCTSKMSLHFPDFLSFTQQLLVFSFVWQLTSGGPLLICTCFFSIWVFFYEYSRFTEQQVKVEAISLYPFYHFYPLHRHLNISWVIAAESLPLGIAGSRNRTQNLWYTLSRIHSLSALPLVAAVVRRMLKTRVTLGNISRVLLNLTRKLLLPLMFTQLTFIFSLQFTNYDCFSP